MADKSGFLGKINTYLDDVVKEFKKLSVPDRKQLLGYSYVTVAATVFFTVFVYIVDLVLTLIAQYLYA
jgi:preprotein translocase SecE subunit